MNLTRFLTYTTYSHECPKGISPARWAAMLKWIERNADYVAEFIRK